MALIRFDNIMATKKFPKYYPEINNFDVNDQDVFVCSYPKSGTTWAQEMVWLIGNNLDYEGAKKDLRLRSQFLEYSAMLDYQDDERSAEELKLLPVSLDYFVNSMKFTSQLKPPRYLKTHLPWNLLPKKIRDFQKRPRIIYISRNSKDTCTSYYHFIKILFDKNEKFDEFCQKFLDGNLWFGNYWEYHLSFQNYLNEPNVLSIKYEDMKKDLPGIIRKVANFLNKNLTDEKIKILEKHLSFETMKNNEYVNHQELYNVYKRKFGVNNDNTHFMRTGKTNDYQNYMCPEIIQKFDEMDRLKLGII